MWIVLRLLDMESNKEDKARKVDEKRKGRDDGVPELLQLKTIQE